VVAGVDGSAGSEAALRFAIEDAARRGVRVEALVVYRPPDYWTDLAVVGAADVDRLRARLRTEAETRVRALVGEVTATSDVLPPEVTVRAVHGAPADVLVRESHGADLLVVGSRGHSGLSSVLLGSTSMQCALHATCPVTVVHSAEAHRHRLRLHRERRAERAPAH
jgi:nucleotide-binding universal stress UspA family protein